MAITTKPARQDADHNRADSNTCENALLKYNTNDGTVTMPFGYFREMHDRILPDRYIKCEEKLNTLKRLLKLTEEKECTFVDISDIRMVIGDE